MALVAAPVGNGKAVALTACVAGRLDTDTLPETACVAGKLETDTAPDTGCVAGKFVTDACRAWVLASTATDVG